MLAKLLPTYLCSIVTLGGLAYGFHSFQTYYRAESRIDEQIRLRNRLRASGHLPPALPPGEIRSLLDERREAAEARANGNAPESREHTAKEITLGR